MQLIAVDEARCGLDLGPVVRDREGQAGGGASAVEQDGARSALAVVTPLFRRGDAEVLAEQVEQGDAVVDVHGVVRAVHAQGYVGEVG